jgi:hypothetical protein
MLMKLTPGHTYTTKAANERTSKAFKVQLEKESKTRETLNQNFKSMFLEIFFFLAKHFLMEP